MNINCCISEIIKNGNFKIFLALIDDNYDHNYIVTKSSDDRRDGPGEMIYFENNLKSCLEYIFMYENSYYTCFEVKYSFSEHTCYVTLYDSEGYDGTTYETHIHNIDRDDCKKIMNFFEKKEKYYKSMEHGMAGH